MLFSSMTFIYVFLPVVCSIYLLVRNELKNHVLLIASLVFYAWGEPKYLASALNNEITISTAISIKPGIPYSQSLFT